MAISVKDIQEKEFSIQTSGGYNIEEVDDFLDAISEQLGALIRENLALNGSIKKLYEELSTKDAQLKETQTKLPDYSVDSYFKNLQNAMHESLISAQRIAEETVANAKAEAEKTINEANAEAERTIDDAVTQSRTAIDAANKRVEEAQAESDALHLSAEQYRAGFRKLVEEQLSALKANDLLFQ